MLTPFFKRLGKLIYKIQKSCEYPLRTKFGILIVFGTKIGHGMKKL